MVVGFTTTCTNNAYHLCSVVSSNPANDDEYSIQHYVIKFVSDLRQDYLGTPISSTNKTDRHDINEILLKVTLNTINQAKAKHNSIIY